MSPKRPVTGGGDSKNGVRGTNATLKPKHTRLAAEISTLHASMCTVARKKCNFKSSPLSVLLKWPLSPKRPVTGGGVKMA